MTAYSRILVCGGRDFDNSQLIETVLSDCVQVIKSKAVIIHGGTKGADKLASDWFKAKGYPIIAMDANWTYFGHGAGMIRNGWMIEYCFPDLVIAFPGNKGTKGMISLAKKNKITVFEVREI